jgi:hypothetical protein
VTQQDDFAYRITAALDRGAAELDASTLQRLASLRRHAVAGQHTSGHGHHVLAVMHRHSLATGLLALALLLVGLWMMQNNPPAYSAETDILLLTGDLPPNAYADKTFSKWLDARSPF